MSLLEEPTRGSHSDLEVVIVGARSQPHLFDLGDMLVLLSVSGSFFLLELEFAQIRDSAHRWVSRRRNFDEIEPGLFSSANGLLDRQDTDLLALGIEDAHFGNANLTIGARASWGRWSRDELWTRNRRFSLLNCSDTLIGTKCKAFCGRTHAQFGGIRRRRSPQGRR
jgi:hypothetical protein